MSSLKKTDAQIQADVTGDVGTWPEKCAEKEAAHRVSGVLDVADDVAVRFHSGDAETDTAIARAVRKALLSNASIPHKRIRSTVSNGEVVLEGEVSLFGQSEDASDCAFGVAGVKQVRNRLTLVPEPKGSSNAVRLAIEGAPARHADISAKRVFVAADAGKVVLSGSVPSRAEREAFVDAARNTAGVREVEVRLLVEL
ncbi:MAG TPA: BON domain-containing protein [Polyangiaceae bacterium]|jgi:osmotically-inducible protein OsmY